MGEVINWPGRWCPAVRSVGSTARKKARRASHEPRRLRHPKTQAESAPSETISQRVDGANLTLWPSTPDRPRSGESEICPESLAFGELIMDDKSMQPLTNLQLTLPALPGRIVRMVGRPERPTSPATYRAAFFKRVRTARELYTEDYKVMAHALGIQEGTYYRYETRTMLPHHLVPRFCQLTGVNADWLFNGPSAARALTPARTGTDHS
jgi:hypothetical protein